jgi:ribosomal protein S18 acetylase RimI-like enzyme
MVKIRKADIDDVEIITSFQIKMALETENLELDKKTVKKGVTSVFKNKNKGQYYVAEENNKIIGSLLVTPEWSDWRNGTILWIQSTYVTPVYRRKGVFKYMYNHLKKQVKKSDNLLGLRLYVDKTNQNAQKTYEKLGMNDEHYKTYEWIKN